MGLFKNIVDAAKQATINPMQQSPHNSMVNQAIRSSSTIPSKAISQATQDKLASTLPPA